MPNEPKESPAKSEAKEAKSPIAYKYVAKHGEYLHGIPTRDLTEDDMDGLKGRYTESTDDGKVKDVTKKTIEASGLYEKGGG